MTVELVVTLVRDLGFPIAVAGFVLIRLERRLQQLTEAITALRVCLARSGEGDHRPPPP